jgi:hypothetical protein
MSFPCLIWALFEQPFVWEITFRNNLTLNTKWTCQWDTDGIKDMILLPQIILWKSLRLTKSLIRIVCCQVVAQIKI